MPKSRQRQRPLPRAALGQLKQPDVTVIGRLEVVERQIEHLATGFEEFLVDHQAGIDEILTNLSEINLRLLFTMEHVKMQVRKRGAILSPDGNDASLEVVDLYELFMRVRDEYLKKVEGRLAAKDANPRDGATAGHGATTTGTVQPEGQGQPRDPYDDSTIPPPSKLVS